MTDSIDGLTDRGSGVLAAARCRAQMPHGRAHSGLGAFRVRVLCSESHNHAHLSRALPLLRNAAACTARMRSAQCVVDSCRRTRADSNRLAPKRALTRVSVCANRVVFVASAQLSTTSTGRSTRSRSSEDLRTMGIVPSRSASHKR
eukprot:3757524-Prymnesium_polylepis.2